MKHLFIILLLISSIFSQQTIAVLDFEGIGVSQEEARALSNRFGSEFLELAGYKFTLVERQAMGEILKEQGLQQSGCVSSECAVEVGAALGAQLIIIGSISQVGAIFSVNARMLDVETAQILKSINYDQVGDIGLLLTKGMREAAAKMLGLELYSNFESKVDKPTQFAEPNKSLNIQGIQKTSSSDYSITTISTVIAVLDFDGKGVTNVEASALSDRLRLELFNTKRYTVVERAMMEEILEEQGFQQSGCTTDECIVEVGRLIGVEQIAGGSISKVGSTYSISARIVSVETGKILKTATYDYRGEIDDLLVSGMRKIAVQLAN